ncbi:MAG: TlpA disulfide reductase family protein [Patescibacteria group bacterium]
MLNRLVAPLGFLIGLVALAYVMQTLGNSSPTNKPLAGPELLKQFEIVEIVPPTAIVNDKDGKKIDLTTLFAKPTLLTFWSVNCGECDTGLPVLDNFANNQSQIAVIMIDTKDEPKDADAKLKLLDVTLGTYFDLDGSAFQNWEATMPASYFVINGKIKYYFPGRVSQEHLDALLTVQ